MKFFKFDIEMCNIEECYNLKKFDTEIKNCFYRLELELKK